MKILLTGGQGFLGRRVLDFLLERGYDVRTITRRPAPELAALGAETIQADLLETEAVARAARGVCGVVHCAAKSGIWGSMDEYIRANTLTTVNVINAARRAGAAWLVHTSSPSVVHSGRSLEGVDESAPYTSNDRNGYPYSKMLAEKIVLAADEPGFRTLALRPHLIWGPGDPHFLPRMVQRARAGRLWLLKSEALVDATYIDNAAEAHWLAVQKLAAGAGIGGRAYFIAQGEPLTCRELAARLLGALSTDGEQLRIRGILPAGLGLASGKILEKIWSGLRLKGEPPLTSFVAEELTLAHWFRLDRAKSDLDYKPRISTEEGLHRLAAARRTVQSFCRT